MQRGKREELIYSVPQGSCVMQRDLHSQLLWARTRSHTVTSERRGEGGGAGGTEQREEEVSQNTEALVLSL